MSAKSIVYFYDQDVGNFHYGKFGSFLFSFFSLTAVLAHPNGNAHLEKQHFVCVCVCVWGGGGGGGGQYPLLAPSVRCPQMV